MSNTQVKDDSIPVLLSPDILKRVDAIAKRVSEKELTFNKEKLTRTVLRTPRMRITKFLELMCETLETRLSNTESRNEINSLLKLLKSKHLNTKQREEIVAKLTGNDGSRVDMSQEFEESVPVDVDEDVDVDVESGAA